MIPENNHAVVARSGQSKYARKHTENLTGRRFSRLLVIENAGPQPHGNRGKLKTKWRCLCDCGNEKLLLGCVLKRGAQMSCGCFQKERRLEGSRGKGKHNRSRTPEYAAWSDMRGRCRNPKNQSYHRYGGRGIKICERWDQFENFLEDMGLRPNGRHSLERKDNDGDYCPENCKWAVPKEQANNRGNNRIIEWNGQRRTVTQWRRSLGFKRGVLESRIFKWNWAVEEAFTTPSWSLQSSVNTG